MTGTNDLREIVGKISDMITARDDLIRARLAAGASPTELAKEAGLSRARIYQIKDRRR